MTIRVLVIDDQRSFKHTVHEGIKVVYARTIDDAISLLPPFNDEPWDEIWLDFDMGEKQTVYDLLKYSFFQEGEWWESFQGMFYIHSSNPVGSQMMVDMLHDFYFDYLRVNTSDYMEVVEQK